MEEHTPEISVIMGIYNPEDETILRAAVDSILSQTFNDLEFIIYDDGSDETQAEQINKLKDLDPRIKIIGKDINKGLAFSLNECIGLARGRYIARMDADDISLPQRLQEEYEFLEKNHEYSWVGCNAYLFDDSGIWGKRNYPEKPEERDYLKYSPYIHPTVMYRMDIFRDGNKYLISKDTLRCEDYELFMRLRKKGYHGYNIQKYLFCYREDSDSFHRRNMKFRINEVKIRYNNFKELGIMFPFGWLYVIRPIIGGIMPKKILKKLKRLESARVDR